MMRHVLSILSILLAFILVTPGVAGQSANQLRETVESILADAQLQDGFWGVHIVDLSNGNVLVDYNSGRNFIPASTMKLLTTAAGLEILGPDYRFTTSLYLDGERSGSMLDGNLVVRGGGDPTISDRQFIPRYPTEGDPLALFRNWALTLKENNITYVTGHIIGDSSFFDDELLGNGWAWDDEPTPFAAQISALSFNEGRLTVTATGAGIGQPARIRVSPETDYVYVVNQSESVAGSANSRIRREPSSNTLWVESRIPAGQTLDRRISVHNPGRYFAHVFRATLREEGITIDGDPVIDSDWWQGLDYPGMQLIASHVSPPLADIAAVTNKISQNLYAEHLLRTLGAERCADARAIRSTVDCGSAEAGLIVADTVFERAGMRTDRMRLRDGSGMSPYNMLAPIDLTKLLQYMWNHPDSNVRDTFIASLAVGGQDGTLSRRFTTGPANGRVYAKTGTVTGARNLAGYVQVPGGPPVAFAILANQFGTSTSLVTRAQNNMVEAIARYRP